MAGNEPAPSGPSFSLKAVSEHPPVVLQILFLVHVTLLLAEGVALASGNEWAHLLGPVQRSGTHRFDTPVASEVTLPQKSRGVNALWLRPGLLAYWSSLLHVGFRWQGLPMPFFLGATGLVCSGTMALSEDGMEAVWTERVRPWPPLFILSLGLIAPVLFEVGHLGLALLLGAFYSLAALGAWAVLAAVGMVFLKTARLNLLRGALIGAE